MAPASAQLGKKLKGFSQKVKEKVDDPFNQDQNEGGEYGKLRAKQLRKDTTYYNYGLAQAEKISFFNSRDDNQNLLLVAAKNYDNSNVEKQELLPYERAFDFNRQGSNALVLNKKLALINFNAALGLYLDGTGIGNLIFANDTEGNVIEGLTASTLGIEDQYAVAKTFMNLGIYHHSRGHYNYAEQLNRSLADYVRNNLGPNSLALAATYNNLALIERDLGNYTESEDHFAKARRILSNSQNREKLDMAVLLNNEAMVFQEIGQYQKAIDKINESLAMASEEINNKGTDYSKIRLNKALILKAQQKYSEAESLLIELRQLKEKRFGKRHQDYADIQSILASVYIATGQLEKVKPLLLEALDIYENKFSKSHPAYTSTLRTLAQFDFLQGDFEEALAKSNEVKSLIMENFGDKSPDYLQITEDLAVINWNLEDTPMAEQYFREANKLKLEFIGKFFPSLSENEKSKLWAKMRPGFEKFFAYVGAQATPSRSLLREMYDIQLATKGILLSSTSKVRREILASDDGELRSLYTQWIALKEELANYYSLSKAEVTDQGIDIEATEHEANQLEKELGRKSTAFASINDQKQIKSSALQQQLSADEAAVEIVRIQQFKRQFNEQVIYVALVLDTEGISMTKFSNGDELEGRLANVYRKSIQFKVNDQKSYESFWRPINDLLTAKKTVYLSLDGIYNQISINTLQKPSGTYVGDEVLLITVASTRDIQSINRVHTPQSKVLMFGFPDYGGTGEVAALPGTKTELEKIGAIVSEQGLVPEQYFQKEANERIFKRQTQSPEVLHIATHGFFLNDISAKEDVVYGVEIGKARENPLLRSGLMLANAERTIKRLDDKQVSSANNGILTAYEAMNLDLSGTKMVVLSACETGLGEIQSGEGVYGLQRAFQIAGAETIVMSLWKVDDAATQELMTNFYREWIQSGDKLLSFQKAQKALREKYEEPYYWGAFVMMN